MIDVRCCHDLTAARPWRDAINALNLSATRPDPFSTFEFYENYLGNGGLFADGESQRLWLLLAFSDDQLVGYLALKRCVHKVLGLRAAKLDLLTAHKADRPHLVTRPGQAATVSAAIYIYLLGRKKEWSLLEFGQQDDTSVLLPPAHAAAAGCRVRQWPNMANGTIAIRWRSTAEYFAALSKKARSNVSRQMRTLLAAGEVQVLSSSDPQVIMALFELYRSIEPHSWKAETGAAISQTQQSVQYYAGLMAPVQPMRVGIQLLLLDGVPIAGLITGTFGRGLYALHIVYDDRMARLAPGSAMLLLGVRRAVEGGYEFFNLLHGFGYYKTRWLAEMSETWSLQIYRMAAPYFWRRVLGDARRRWFGNRRADDDTALTNPARRKIARGCPPALDQSLPRLASPEERLRYALLIAQVRVGRGEFLSAAQLAAAMPFATSITPASPLTHCARLTLSGTS